MPLPLTVCYLAHVLLCNERDSNGIYKMLSSFVQSFREHLNTSHVQGSRYSIGVCSSSAFFRGGICVQPKSALNLEQSFFILSRWCQRLVQPCLTYFLFKFVFIDNQLNIVMYFIMFSYVCTIYFHYSPLIALSSFPLH